MLFQADMAKLVPCSHQFRGDTPLACEQQFVRHAPKCHPQSPCGGRQYGWAVPAAGEMGRECTVGEWGWGHGIEWPMERRINAAPENDLREVVEFNPTDPVSSVAESASKTESEGAFHACQYAA